MDPDPWGQMSYESTLSARRAISDILDRPLAELPADDLSFISDLVGRTLNKAEVEDAIKDRFRRN